MVSWIDCRIEDVVEAGDHWFVIGRVHQLDVDEADEHPLLFFRGKLGGFTPGVVTRRDPFGLGCAGITSCLNGMRSR